MEKKIIALKKNDNIIHNNGGSKEIKPKFDTMEQLNGWVFDLSETERKKQETAKEISDNLQYFVDQKNKKAIGYMDNFRSRIQEKLEHKIWKKYFGKQSKTEILPQIHKDDDIYAKWKSYEDEIKTTTNIVLKTEFKKKVYETAMKKEFKKKVYEAIKRVFNKEITSHGGSDIDKEAGFLLLKLAKFFENTKGEKVDYTKKSVSHGERAKKGFEYDSGGTRNGLDIINYIKAHEKGPHKGETYKSLFNTLAIVDEHDKSDGAKNIIKPTSSTHIIYNLLNELGVLHPEHKDQIKRFVDFVDKADSQHYQFAGADKEVSHKTLFGLHRKVPIKNIYEYFETPGHTGFEVLNEEELKKLNIKNENQEKENEKKISEQQELDEKGRFGNFNNQRFIFALGKEFSGGQQIAGENYGLFKIFESGDLYMYSPTPLPKKIYGFATNDHFLNIKKVELKDLKKILDMFEFGIHAEEGLKENFLAYRKTQIEKEKEIINRIEKTEKEKKANLLKLENTEDHNYFKKDGKYPGMINNIQNKIAYVTLNRKGTINGMIRVEDKQELKKYAVGDVVKVMIKENIVDEEGKLKIGLSIVPATE